MSTKLKQLKKKQAEIESFFKELENKSVPGASLRKWIIDSVIHFTEVGVSVNLIDLFIQRCEFREDENGKTSHGIFEFSLLRRGYTLKDHGKTEDTSPFIIPVRVALNVSGMLVDKYEEEERIIPASLIRLFNVEKHQSIKLALENIESNYQENDPYGILSPLVTATELICKLIPELKEERNVSACLNKLHEAKELHEKYHVNRDIVWALNSARIIRNEEVVHTKSEHAGNVPMYEVVGYAHLLVLFTDSLLASGQCDFD